MNTQSTLLPTPLQTSFSSLQKSFKLSMLTAFLGMFTLTTSFAQEDKKTIEAQSADTTKQIEAPKEKEKNYLPHKYEIGVRANSLTNSQLTFGISNKENRLIRFRALGLTLGLGLSPNNDFSIGGGLAVGFQRYFPIKDDLSFYHGIEPGISYRYYNVNLNAFSARLGYMFGASYDITKNFKLYAEVTPFIAADHIYQAGANKSYTTRIYSDLNTFNFNFGLHYKF